MSGPLRIERDGPLAVVVLDSPPLNLCDDAMLDALGDAIDELEAGADRGLLIRADGRVVTGGVDVKLFAALDSPEHVTAWFGRILDIATRFERLPMPTVFGAHALCLTWGLELALTTDVLLATESARFGLVERRVGLTPGMGGTQRFAARAGSARAAEFVMTGELYDARTLSDWGVVNRVLPEEGFAEACHAFAMDLAAGPTRAHAATKRIIRAQREGGVPAADAIVPEVEVGLYATEDLQNAVASFLRDGPDSARFEGR